MWFRFGEVQLHTEQQFGNCLKVGGKGNTGQVGESQRGIVIQNVAAEAEKAKPMYFLFVLIFFFC